MNLQELLSPQKIAIIGATESPQKVGNIVFSLLLKSERELYPVHPTADTIMGYKAYNMVSQLPSDIDLAIITTAAHIAVDATEQCAQHGIPFVIIVAGGFGEIGSEGKVLEKRLSEIPIKYPTRILGPNSLGYFIPHEKIDTIFVEHGDKSLSTGGGVAALVQSGSVGVEALGYASSIGFGMRAFIGLGNKSDLNEIDFLDYFKNDKGTTCISYYLESIDSGKEFLIKIREVAQHKPVVILKSGRTQKGATAASSHTGKLAGADNIINGAFRQYGVQRVFDEEEYCDASKILSLYSPPKGNRIAIVSPTGGYGVMLTDYIESKNPRAHLQMAYLSDETKKSIHDATFSFASCNNPIDLTGTATNAMFPPVSDALIDDQNVDIIIIGAFFSPPGINKELISIIAQKCKQTDKPIIVLSSFGSFTNEYLNEFFKAGVAAYPTIYRTIRATSFLVERAEILKKLGVK